MKMVWLTLLCAGMVMAAESDPGAQTAEKVGAKLSVGELIAKRMGAAPAPRPLEFSGGVTLTVSATSDEVQQAVRDGLTCLHAGWDFEAFRYFGEAIQADPNCLMAYWGAALSLFHGSADMSAERDAVLDKMLSLVDAGVGTDLEHRYVFALAKLIESGAEEGAHAFAAAAVKYPGDPQLSLLQALLSRGGYDDWGQATPNQERAGKRVRKLIAEHPDLLYLKASLLAMEAEAPDLRGDLEMARQLCREISSFAPYFHILGHYEWRCGNFAKSEAAFLRAVELYADWMLKNDMGMADCPGWTKSESYRAVALASQGDYVAALGVAEGIFRTPVKAEAALRDGARLLLWEGKTLPVRLLMRRDGKGDMKQARELLPPPKDMEGIRDYSLAVWAVQAHSTVVGARYAIASGELEAARTLSEDLTRIGGNFVELRGLAMERAEISLWARNFHAMEVMASELNGLLAMAGPENGRGTAYNWYRSAIDRQKRATLMMPPSVLLPMEARMAEFQMAEGKAAEAVATLRDGLKKWPNDFELLTRLQHAAEKASDKTAAQEAAAKLKELTDK